MKFSEWYRTIDRDKDAQGNWCLPLVSGDFGKWCQCLDYIMSKLTPDPHLKDTYYFNADIGSYCFIVHSWVKSEDIPTNTRLVNTVTICLETDGEFEYLYRCGFMSNDGDSWELWTRRLKYYEKYVPDDSFTERASLLDDAIEFGPVVCLNTIVQACEDTLEQKFNEVFSPKGIT